MKRSVKVHAAMLTLTVYGFFLPAISNSAVGAALESVTVNPSSVTGGQSSTGTVTLTGAAPRGGALVSLSSSSTAAQVPTNVTVPYHATSATFTITTSAVNTSTPVTISATDNGVTKTAALTVGLATPTATLSANPTTIPLGESTTLSWSTTNATISVSINGGQVSSTGSTTVSPTANTTYTLTAMGPGGTVTQSILVIVGTSTINHYAYVMPDQTLYVYDLDNNFQLLKSVSIPQARGVRGIGTVPSTNTLYISYGGDGGINGNGNLLAYDLLTDTVMWTKSYSHGIDSFAISKDGTTIYLPSGVDGGTAIWYIIDATTGDMEGDVIGDINTGWNGAHDTVVSLDGKDVFMGPHLSPYLVEATTSNNSVVLNTGPLEGSGTSPFTINGGHTLAFTTEMSFFGFEVSYTKEGAQPGEILYTVPVSGYSVPPGFANNPADHGISLSPDETQLYLIDTANAYVHVFDVSKLPGTEPSQVANIPLSKPFTGNQSPCVYDCEREGWLLHTMDGQYVLVGDSGDVIITSTQEVIANAIPQLYNTRIYEQINWQYGLPISESTRTGLGYVTP